MRCKQTTHFFFIPKVVHFVLKSCTFRFGDYTNIRPVHMFFHPEGRQVCRNATCNSKNKDKNRLYSKIKVS